jgi:hypothetical protein
VRETRRGVALLAPPVAELAALSRRVRGLVAEASGEAAPAGFAEAAQHCAADLGRQVEAVGAAIGAIIAGVPRIQAAERGFAQLSVELQAAAGEAPAPPDLARVIAELGAALGTAQAALPTAALLAAAAAGQALADDAAGMPARLHEVLRAPTPVAARRAAARIPVDLPASLLQAGVTIGGRIVDLSTGGGRFLGPGAALGEAALEAAALPPLAVRVLAVDAEGANLAFATPLDEAQIATLLAGGIAELVA